jgi:hypothetical protein
MSQETIPLMVVVFLLAGCATGGSSFPRPRVPAAPDGAPRTLLIALDGVPLRVLEEARAQGAFAGWPEAAALVSPFPTMTSVSFTRLFEPFGVAPAPGYELHHYDPERNRVHGGSPFGYRDRVYGWKTVFDVSGKNLPAKLSQFAAPRPMSRWELRHIEEELIRSPREVILGYVGSTDGLQHLEGDPANVELLHDLDERLKALKKRHREERGRPLRVVVFSDHGCTAEKIHFVHGVRRALRDSGLRVRKRLDGPDDVVAATFGLAGYVALYFGDRSRVEDAAEALVTRDGVELAVWNGSGRVSVLSREGRAEIHWRDDRDVRRYAYRELEGDPLRLVDIREAMRAEGLLDEAGFGTGSSWFERTALADYPDPLRRLVDAFEGHAVRSRAHLLLSRTGPRPLRTLLPEPGRRRGDRSGATRPPGAARGSPAAVGGVLRQPAGLDYSPVPYCGCPERAISGVLGPRDLDVLPSTPAAPSPSEHPTWRALNTLATGTGE